MSKSHVFKATDANRDPENAGAVSALSDAELDQVAGGYVSWMVDGEEVRIYPKWQN